jgi:hypothetical protein
MNNDAAVKKPVVDLQRGADDEDQIQIPGGGDNGFQPLPDGGEKGILVKQVIVGVGRKAQLRKECENGLVGDGLFCQQEGLGDIERRVSDANLRNADRYADKPVAVKIEKGVHGDST